MPATTGENTPKKKSGWKTAGLAAFTLAAGFCGSRYVWPGAEGAETPPAPPPAAPSEAPAPATTGGLRFDPVEEGCIVRGMAVESERREALRLYAKPGRFEGEALDATRIRVQFCSAAKGEGICKEAGMPKEKCVAQAIYSADPGKAHDIRFFGEEWRSDDYTKSDELYEAWIHETGHLFYGPAQLNLRNKAFKYRLMPNKPLEKYDIEPRLQMIAHYGQLFLRPNGKVTTDYYDMAGPYRRALLRETVDAALPSASASRLAMPTR